MHSDEIEGSGELEPFEKQLRRLRPIRPDLALPSPILKNLKVDRELRRERAFWVGLTACSWLITTGMLLYIAPTWTSSKSSQPPTMVKTPTRDPVETPATVPVNSETKRQENVSAEPIVSSFIRYQPPKKLSSISDGVLSVGSRHLIGSEAVADLMAQLPPVSSRTVSRFTGTAVDAEPLRVGASRFIRYPKDGDVDFNLLLIEESL
ncbi:hypothetical protein [Stratiformator vulcanicus]|uniref:Uncharacterized protein n=1 Tax=Stratiformator vulcanicus TaxID=2527980 RepID=A0A517R187_9PLAN|nr:hypothetical protein [Stratiformator vulcanicus]QDT37648.1 hypothetical protein Pan189_20280 [Stratiformator vulcanicus]